MFALLRKGVRGVHCYISWVNKPRHMAGAPEAPAQYMNEWLLSCTMTTTGCKCAFQEFQERVSLCELGPGYTAYILKRNNFMTAFFKVCAEFSKVTEKALVEANISCPYPAHCRNGKETEEMTDGVAVRARQRRRAPGGRRLRPKP